MIRVVAWLLRTLMPEIKPVYCHRGCGSFCLRPGTGANPQRGPA